MEKRKFFAGLFVMLGLIFGSLFTNFVYKDYLAYGGQLDSFILNNKNLYISGSGLFPYVLFKRGKQYGMFFLAGYLLQPVVFLYGGLICGSFFLGSILSLQIIQLGIKGLLIVLLSFFPQFICYGFGIALLFRRNFLEAKKEGRVFEKNPSFLDKHSVLIEILSVISGCILESYINPVMMLYLLNFLKIH